MQVGDLVTCRGHGGKVGIVVEKRNGIGGLEGSLHSRHLVASLPSVYYVFFYDEGTTGPYHGAEMEITQSLDDFKH